MSETNWRVVGRIAGPVLPTKPTRIGSVHIGPCEESKIIPDRPVGANAKPEAPAHAVFSTGDVRIAPYCYFWVDRVASDSETALDLVRRVEAPLLQATLSLRQPGSPYLVELLGAVGPQGGEGTYVYFGATFWHPVDPTEEQLATFSADYQALETDKTGRLATGSLSAAIRQSVTNDSPAGLDGALLEYFKVIELIVRVLPVEPPNDIAEIQAAIVGELTGQLNSPVTIEKKLMAVGEADKRIGRLAVRYLDLKIDLAKSYLGLSEQWRLRAREFSVLRNSRLGHGGPTMTADERSAWLNVAAQDGAYAIAREILLAYASKLQNKEKPAV